MPVYVYNCPDCELEIEEKRPMGEADAPLECPLCGEFCERVFAVSFGVWKSGAVEPVATPAPRFHTFGCSCCRR
jgi:putative FmdB family regulatory protein